MIIVCIKTLDLALLEFMRNCKKAGYQVATDLPASCGKSTALSTSLDARRREFDQKENVRLVLCR